MINGCIDHSYTRLGATSKYSATANLHNSQIITAPAKHFPACYFFTSRFVAVASNSGHSSYSRAQVFLHSQPNNTPIVACVFVASGTCFRRHVTILCRLLMCLPNNHVYFTYIFPCVVCSVSTNLTQLICYGRRLSMVCS
jgi:hypothetical protein